MGWKVCMRQVCFSFWVCFSCEYFNKACTVLTAFRASWSYSTTPDVQVSDEECSALRFCWVSRGEAAINRVVSEFLRAALGLAMG